ncbi:MAG: HD domain-containing phosphohydrolase [Acidobacteriota bacterium]
MPIEGRVLVVDDEPGVRDIVGRALTRQGFQCRSAALAEEALKMASREPFDLAIADIRMPGHDGIWLLKQCRERLPELPVIMLTAVSEAQTAVDCLRMGADDYLMKPVNLEQLAISSRRAIEKSRLVRENRKYQCKLERMVEDRTVKLRQALVEIEQTYQATLETLVAALDARERETGCHSQRVMCFTVRLARKMGVPEEEIQGIARGALLHDIGKVGVPDSILLKADKLTEEEWVEMRKHPEIGYQILHGIPFLEDAREIILSHQEHWDGKGYPRGLEGEKIPLGARIFAVADTLDAMTSTRPYRHALPYQAARAEIIRCSGTQFDPRVVEVFLSIPEKEWERIRQESSLEGKTGRKDPARAPLDFHPRPGESRQGMRVDGEMLLPHGEPPNA